MASSLIAPTPSTSSGRDDNTDAPAVSPYLQGLVLTLEAKTGYIRAWVGGRDFEDSKFNRVNQSRRQPGSIFKPFVYTAALEAGHPLSEIIVDDSLSMEFPADRRRGRPRTTTSSSRGAMTLRRALYQSRNIPAIKLGMEVGAGERHRRGPPLRRHHRRGTGAVHQHRCRRRGAARDHLGLHRVRQ